MNSVDLTLSVLLVVCALRGYWRGFFRECFGLLALIGGMVAAVEFAGAGAGLLQERFRIPVPVDVGVAFVLIFVIVHTSVNLVGVLLDRLAGALFLRGVTRLAGAAVGAGKGVAVLAFLLLFLHLFPLVPTLDEQIMRSTIGRPLVTAAGSVARLGLHDAARPDSSNKT